jgi:hypothetical protein
MEMLLKLNLYPSENSCIGKLVNNWGMFRRIGAPRKRRCHDHQEVRAAHNPVRLPRGVRDVARRTPRDFGRTVAQARQERLRIRDGLISRSPRRRPVLRLDRQPGGQLRRPALVAPVHPAPAEEQVVAGQPPQGRQTDRGGQDETCRPAGGEARQSPRPLGGVVI